MPRILLILILGLPFHSAFKHNDNELFLIIRDFVGYYKYPIKLIHLCDNKDFQIEFQKNSQKNMFSLKLNHTEIGEKNKDDQINVNYFIILDMACSKSPTYLKQAVNLHLFTNHYWFILVNNNLFTQTNIFPINSNVFIFEPMNKECVIKRINGKFSNSTKNSETSVIGYWSKNSGFIKVSDISKLQQENKPFGANIKISYVVEDIDTTFHLNEYQYRTLIDTVTKYNYALLQHLIYLVNGSKTEYFRKGFASKKVNDTTFVGMLDDVSQDVDIGGTPVKFLSDRVDKFDLLARTAKLEKKFIFRATPHSYISNVFTLPFDLYVWYSCFVLLATIFVVAYLVVYWEWKDPIFKTYLSPRLCLRPHPVDICLMEIGSAAQQGFEVEPKSNSGRIVFIFTLISLMFLYTAFSASIVALLQSTTESLNSLENLLDSRIPVGFENNISMNYFKDLNYQKKSREFYIKLQKPIFFSIEHGVEKVKREFFAFYADTSKIYKYVNDWFFESEKCGLREIKFKHTNIDDWLIIRKNSTYKDIFRTSMLKIHESGLRSREHRRFFATKPECFSVGGNFESVGLADSYGAFLFMTSGFALSVLLFLAEAIWAKYGSWSVARIVDLQFTLTNRGKNNKSDF